MRFAKKAEMLAGLTDSWWWVPIFVVAGVCCISTHLSILIHRSGTGQVIALAEFYYAWLRDSRTEGAHAWALPRLRKRLFDKMEGLERFTHSPTPPLPVRNPNHRYAHWKSPPSASNSSAKLVPRPLFSKRTDLPPMKLHVEVHKILDWSTRPTSSQSSIPQSPTASFKSFGSYASSTSTVSGINPVPARSTRQGYELPPPDVCNWGNEWEPLHGPRRRLRRTRTPKKETLRDLREKGSDMCLQRVYEQQLDLYLNGALFPRKKWKDDLGRLDEG